MMIRTIQQRIYVVGLLPLATLAVVLVVYNGLARIDEAHEELRNAQTATAALLQSPAVDALVIGNTLNFEQSVRNVIRTSALLACVVLRDVSHRMVAQVGECSGGAPTMSYVPIIALSGDLSDFDPANRADVKLGDLGIAMNGESVVGKRRQVIVQLVLSLSLVGIVLAFVTWLLRVRLIEPIARIGRAMRALSARDYNVRVAFEGDDELTRLAEAINTTIDTIASYTRELERRRSDADRALQDADEANLARDSLVRSLSEDLEEPLSVMHAELTAIAMANHDPSLRERIKVVMVRLQQAQADFADLMEIASSTQGAQNAPPRDLADILSDIERDIALLSNTDRVSINLAMGRMPSAQHHRGEPMRMFVDVDAVRLRKALVYLIRTMGRRAKESRVYVNAEFLMVPIHQLNVSLHLRTFCEPLSEPATVSRPDGLSRYGSVPAILGWANREARIIDYLLRAVGLTPTVSVSPTGVVTILLDLTCHYTTEPDTHGGEATRPIFATLVSNDLSLMRMTRRADISSVEVRLVSLPRALAQATALTAEAVLLIDISEEIGEAVGLVEQLRAQAKRLPCLIAICPPGRISDSLSERLLDLGFAGAIQKPLHYSRLIEVIRTALSDPLRQRNQLGGA